MIKKNQARSSTGDKVPVVGQTNTAPILSLDLELHGNAITHSQDEPEPSHAQNLAPANSEASLRRGRGIRKKAPS
jgi:hypothetical protein